MYCTYVWWASVFHGNNEPHGELKRSSDQNDIGFCEDSHWRGCAHCVCVLLHGIAMIS